MIKDNKQTETEQCTIPSFIESFECSFCGNDWSLDEGFVLKTMQCKGCQDYDDTKPQRDKEMKERMKWVEEFKNVNFQYVAGDPYW
jgi:hypothetical protein